jgi:hypothetical protein
VNPCCQKHRIGSYLVSATVVGNTELLELERF